MDEEKRVEVERAKLFQFLNATLNNRATEPARRVDAGLVLLNHYAREGATAGVYSAEKTGIRALIAVIRGTLRDIALDEDVDAEQRLRAAGAAL